MKGQICQPGLPLALVGQSYRSRYVIGLKTNCPNCGPVSWSTVGTPGIQTEGLGYSPENPQNRFTIWGLVYFPTSTHTQS
jgi:hypothetical protein